MFNKQQIVNIIKKYYKPVLTTLAAFLLGYFFSKNGAFLILGSGKNVKIEMTSYDDLETDTFDVSEVNFFPREPIYLVLHCDATYPDMNPDRTWYTACFKQKYGTNWRYGYHGVVKRDGEFIELIHLNRNSTLEYNEIAWGVKGMNSVCIDLAYSGGIDEDGKPSNTLTTAQLNSLKLAIRYYKALYPDLIVVPHNHFNKAKACPSFDIKLLFED